MRRMGSLMHQVADIHTARIGDMVVIDGDIVEHLCRRGDRRIEMDRHRAVMPGDQQQQAAQCQSADHGAGQRSPQANRTMPGSPTW